MNEIAQSRWYLSLRWKLLGAVFTLMSILPLVLGTFAYQKLGQQQAFLLESQHHALQQHLRRAVNQAVEDAVSSAHQVLLYLGPGGYAPQLSHKDLSEQWPDMQLAWVWIHLDALRPVTTVVFTWAACRAIGISNGFSAGVRPACPSGG